MLSTRLCGAPGAGKNAVGDILGGLYGYRVSSFAEALRQEVAGVTLHGQRIPHDIVCDPRLEELATLLVACLGMSPWEKPTPDAMRGVLQLWGTEYRRAQDKDYWVNRADKTEPVAFTDARYHNETACVHARGGELWWIERPGLSRGNGHISNWVIGPDDCDRIVSNGGT